MTVNTLKLNRISNIASPSIVNNQDLEKRIFKGLVFALAVLFASYIYFVGHTVFNIVARKAIDVDARNLTSAVSSLELEYFSLSNKIDLSYAESAGFINPNQTAFANRENLAMAQTLAINAPSTKN